MFRLFDLLLVGGHGLAAAAINHRDFFRAQAEADRAASMAELPPPMTTTFLPTGTEPRRLYVRRKFRASVTPVGVFARNPQRDSHRGAQPRYTASYPSRRAVPGARNPLPSHIFVKISIPIRSIMRISRATISRGRR